MKDNEYPHAGSVFIKNLTELMNKSGDTHASLAAALNRSSSAVTHWLTGRFSPRTDVTDRIAARYGVDPLWLTGIKTFDTQEEEQTPIIQGVPHDMIELAQNSDMAPTIPNGSHVFITKTTIIPYGTVAYVSVNSELMLRRIFREENIIVLTADNPQIKPMVFTGAKKKQVEVIGKATRVIYELE